MTKAQTALLEAVEALCRVYIGKNAPSEPWGETCARLEALDKLTKRVRKEAARAVSQ